MTRGSKEYSALDHLHQIPVVNQHFDRSPQKGSLCVAECVADGGHYSLLNECMNALVDVYL